MPARIHTSFCCALLLTATCLPAADWPQWRGPGFSGSSPDSSPPRQWSKTENVAWTAELPGPSAATPIVWKDHVFVSSTHREEKLLLAQAYDRRTGKRLWSEKVADGYGRDERSNYASPSPLTDGKLVWFFYGNGHLVAFDLDGKQVWSRNICADYGDFAFQWTFASTPLLFQNRLYVQVLQRNEPVNGRGRKGGPIESFLLAMDPATGKTLWQAIRPSDAVAESHEAYSTPIPFTYNGRTELLIAGGDCLTGHAPDSGAELWRWGTWNPQKIGHWRYVPSPAPGGDVILVCAPKGDPVFAIKAGGKGKLNDTAVAWTSERSSVLSSDVPTPLFYQGDYFILSDVRKALTRVEPATGKVKWTLSTPGQAKYEASPTAAGGLIYTMNFRGDVIVVDAAKGELIATVPMGEPGDDSTRSTVAIAHNQLFVRTNTKLFCVGKP
jgi:outer membrane protein assembly factor BamB